MRILTEVAAEALLAQEGFPVVNRVLTRNIHEAERAAKKLTYPVVLKIASDSLIHKSDINAVRLNIRKEELPTAYRDLQKITIKKEGILVQRYIPGKYILIGLKKDPTFGHVLVVGTGGIYTEIINDISMRIVPITRSDAFIMLKELKSYNILKGYRGEKVNISHIIDVLMKTSRLAEKYADIKELDINPLIINEKEATIVDARIVFEE